MVGAGRPLVACSGSAGNAPVADNRVPGTWVVAGLLIAGEPSFVCDLAPTLPGGMRRGGRFSVDTSGAALPPGVNLSPEGILSLTGGAKVGVTDGVVFAYAEPA
jgi:hypothetical protein